MQDQPLTNKTFVEFLEEFKKTNKLDTASNLLRTKYAREEVGPDNDKREKQLDTINESMLEVKKAIESLSKNLTKSNDQVVKKLTEIQKTSAQYNPLSNIKDSRPITVREELKSGVAGVKRFGSSLAEMGSSAFRNLRAFVKDPLQATRVGLEKTGRGVEKGYGGIGKGIKDIFGTSKDYTVEGGRFAEAFTKSPRGGLMQGKKTGFDVGLTKFNEMQAKEEEIKKLEDEIAISTRQGFEAPKGKTRQLEKLKSEFVELDPRKKIAPIETKVETPKIETAPIETKKVDSLIVDQYGKPLQRDQTVEEAKAAKEERQQTTTPNQNKSGLILPTGFQTEESSSVFPGKETFSEKLVKLTEKSLAELKKISKAVTGSAATAAAASAPGQAAAGGSGGGGGSMIGDAVSGAASAGIGGKILGGLATAGKVVGGALLSKPALIAGGVALAGYGAYKGYQAIKGAFGGGGESGEQSDDSGSTKTQVKVKESLDLGKFADKDPKGHQEFVNFRIKRAGEIFKELQRKNNKNKDPDIRQDNQDTAEAQAHEEAVEKFKDKLVSAGAYQSSVSVKKQEPKDSKPREMSLDEMKAMRQREVDRGPRTKNQQSIDTHREKLRTMDMAIEAKEKQRPDSQQIEYEKRVEDKLSAYPPKMREDVDIRGDAEEETSIEMGGYVPGQHLRRNNKGKYRDQPVSEVQPKDGGFMKVGLSKNKKSALGALADATGFGDNISAKEKVRTGKIDELNKQFREGTITSEEYKEKVKELTPDTRSVSKRIGDFLFGKPEPEIDVITGRRKSSAPVEGGFKKISSVPSVSTENAAMREEMAATKGTTTPIVANNIQTSTQNNFVPVKADPRPLHRGSALERYNDRIASYI